MKLPLCTEINLLLLATVAMLSYSLEIGAQVAEEVSFEHEGLTVFGTFNKPDGEGPFETLIIGPGSGANDRDGTLALVGPNIECLYPNLEGDILRPYKQLAEALADSGYAVLRYDKLEYTYTNELEPITFKKLWLPVNSAIDYVKQRVDVDTNSITLIGHSESGYLIPYIANNRNDVHRMISIAGPRAPFDTLLTNQIVDFAVTCDGDVALATAQANEILDYYDIVRSGDFTSSTPPLFGVSPAVWSDYLEVIDSTAINYNLASLPTLFLGLGLDVNVPPVELERLENDVSIPDADFWSIPDLNHYMTPMDDPDISTVLTDTIVYWLRLFPTLTSVENIGKKEINLKVYPNPFEGNSLNLTMDKSLSGLCTIRILDVAGREVYTKKKYFSDPRFQLHHLEKLKSGIYTLELSNEKLSARTKIVKRQ